MKMFIKRIILLILSVSMLAQPLHTINIAPTYHFAPQPTANDFATLAIGTELSHVAAQQIGMLAYRGYHYIKNKLITKPTSTTAPTSAQIVSKSSVLIPACIATAAQSLTQIYLNMKMNNFWRKKFKEGPALPFSYYGLLYGADYIFGSLYNYGFKKTVNNTKQLANSPSSETCASTALSGLCAFGSLYAHYKVPSLINKYFYNIVMPPARFALHSALTVLRSLRPYIL